MPPKSEWTFWHKCHAGDQVCRLIVALTREDAEELRLDGYIEISAWEARAEFITV